MPFKLTHSDVAEITKCPKAAIDVNYPIILKFMREYGLTSDGAFISMLATVPPETAHTFRPIKEMGKPEYLIRNYDVRGRRPEYCIKMGNNVPGDGLRYCGKGFTQTTWKNNYKALRPAFKRFGIPGDPVEYPDILLTSVPAAVALADYFHSHGTCTWADKALAASADPCAYCKSNGAVPGTKNKRPPVTAVVCQSCCWKNTRRTVNGGLNGYDEFKRIVNALLKVRL